MVEKNENKCPCCRAFCVIGYGYATAVPLTNVTTGANVGRLTRHQHIYPSLRAATPMFHFYVSSMLRCFPITLKGYAVYFPPYALSHLLNGKDSVPITQSFGAVREHRPHAPYYSTANNLVDHRRHTPPIGGVPDLFKKGVTQNGYQFYLSLPDIFFLCFCHCNSLLPQYVQYSYSPNAYKPLLIQL